MATRLFLAYAILVLSSVLIGVQTPTPTPDKRPFLMPVEDVFVISGRGVVVTGKIERGSVKTGDTIEIVGIRATKTAMVTGIEMFRKILGEAKAGDNVGILLRGVAKADVSRGQVLARPVTIQAFTKISAKLELFTAANGGRSTPIATGFRPMINARTQSLSATVTLPNSKATMSPGEKDVVVEFVLSEPTPLEKGQVIAIREGGRTIGTAIVVAVIQ